MHHLIRHSHVIQPGLSTAKTTAAAATAIIIVRTVNRTRENLMASTSKGLTGKSEL
jgi:hypothetical protein